MDSQQSQFKSLAPNLSKEDLLEKIDKMFLKGDMQQMESSFLRAHNKYSVPSALQDKSQIHQNWPVSEAVANDPFQGKLTDFEGFQVETVDIEGPNGFEKWNKESLNSENGFIKRSHFSSGWSTVKGGTEASVTSTESQSVINQTEEQLTTENPKVSHFLEKKSLDKQVPGWQGNSETAETKVVTPENGNTHALKGLREESGNIKQSQFSRVNANETVAPNIPMEPLNQEGKRSQSGAPIVAAQGMQKNQMISQDFKGQGDFQRQDRGQHGLEAVGKVEKQGLRNVKRDSQNTPKFLRQATFDRITHLSERLQVQGGGRAKVSINDKEFGKVKLEIQISSDKQIFVELQSDSQELKNIMKQGQGELEKSLQGLNLKLGDFKVSSMESTQNQSFSDNQQQSQQQNNTDGRSFGDSQASGHGFGGRSEGNEGKRENLNFTENTNKQNQSIDKNWKKNVGSHAKGSVSVSV